jgi:hypothetical protein
MGRSVMAAVLSIEPTKRISKPGITLAAQRCLLAIHVKLRKVVASKLILDWSPQQISGFRQLCSVSCNASLSATNSRAIRNSPPPMASQRTTRAAVV